MRPDDFDLFRMVVQRRSGLVLTREKVYLLESRLMPVARKWNLRTLDDLASAVRQRGEEPLLRDVTEAMATAETSFFRDIRPFRHLREDILPALLAGRAPTRRLRIWSAATATGQEAYSLAMILEDEADRLAGWDVGILATDMSRDLLARADAGLYSQYEVQRGLPVQLLVRHFRQQGDRWQIAPALQTRVVFREHNLLDDAAALGRFDLVLCRNVLVYFDPLTRTHVLEGIARALAPDGILMLGVSEDLIGPDDRFVPVEDAPPGIFQPVPRRDAPPAYAGMYRRAAAG